MDKLKDELLLNKNYSFQPCEDDKYFGEFYAKNYEIGKISMVLNNFSSFNTKIDIKSDKTIIKDLGFIISTHYKWKTLCKHYATLMMMIIIIIMIIMMILLMMMMIIIMMIIMIILFHSSSLESKSS
jgi:hypothetical protein